MSLRWEMEEIKLWKVSGAKDSLTIADISNVKQTQTEQMLEEILVKSPGLLADGLTLVGRQIETSGGPLDLLGVDDDGRLVVFELKRGVLTRDAVAQIIDYASFLAELSKEELNSLVNENLGKHGIDKITDNFAEWYQDQFSGKSLDTIGKPKMVLVGLGVDERARRMVEYLANGSIEMSLITFHGFDNSNEVFLARQVKVAPPVSSAPGTWSKAKNLRILLRKIKEFGVESYFDKAAALIRDETNAAEWPTRSGYSYAFPELSATGTPSAHQYLSISIPNNPRGSIVLTLRERAIKAAGREWVTVSQAWGPRVLQKKGDVDVKIASDDDWRELEPNVRRLCVAIVEGRKQSLQEEKAVIEREDAEGLSGAQT